MTGADAIESSLRANEVSVAKQAKRSFFRKPLASLVKQAKRSFFSNQKSNTIDAENGLPRLDFVKSRNDG